MDVEAGLVSGLINPQPEIWLDYYATCSLSHHIPTLEKRSDQNGRYIKHYKKVATQKYLRKHGYKALVREIKAEERKLRANPADESAKKKLDELGAKKSKMEEEAKKAAENDPKVKLKKSENQEINMLEQRIFTGLDSMSGHQAAYGRALVAQGNKDAEDESSKTSFVNTSTDFAQQSTMAAH